MASNISNTTPFGEILTSWRKKRRFSQLSFGLYANVSARHLSFLETGRASPSKEMVLKLAKYLEMPKQEVNRALLGAGFSPAYLARPMDHADLDPIQFALSNLIENHMPYPAIVLDKVWNLIGANDAAKNLLQAAGFAEYKNLLEALAEQSLEHSSIINWEESIRLVLERVRAEIISQGENKTLKQLEQRLSARLYEYFPVTNINTKQAVIPTSFQIGKKIISIFSTIAQFGTIQDLTMDGIKVELMFPLDESSNEYFQTKI